MNCPLFHVTCFLKQVTIAWSIHCIYRIIIYVWAATWQNQQSDCAPSEDSDQPGHPPSLIRVFAVRMKKAWVLSDPLSAQRRLWSDWVDAQADLSLHWAHSHFVCFVMSRLILRYDYHWWVWKFVGQGANFDSDYILFLLNNSYTNNDLIILII